jgi:hypothetical protein
MKQEEPFRMTDSTTAPPSPGTEQEGDLTERGPGFGDKKKVVILAVLFLVGVGVVGYQFLGGTSPKTASATTVASAAMGPAGRTPRDVESILDGLEAAAKASGEEGLSVAKIEQLVKEFDGYVAHRQVPLASLTPNAFQVVQPKAEEPVLAAAAPKKTVVDEAAVRRQRVQDAAARLVLGCVVLAGERRSAMINGKLCGVGDAVDGFEVKMIERDLVRLACEGETADLKLGTASPKGAAARGKDGR